MSQQIQSPKQVFPFWKAIEALTPQKLSKDDPNDKLSPAYNVDRDGVLPWKDPKHCHKPIPQGKVWRYGVQFGVYGLAQFAKLLEDKIGRHEEVFDDRISGKSRVFDIQFNESGVPLYESFTLSLAVWAAGQILEHDDGVVALDRSIPSNLVGLPAPSSIIPEIDSGFSDFDLLSRHLMQWVAEEATRMERELMVADLAWLDRLLQLIYEKTHFPQSAQDPRHACLVTCVQVKAPQPVKEAEHHDQEKVPPAAPDDLLNSFFIDELRQLGAAWQRQDVGHGFTEYMTAVASADPKRIDLRSERGLKAAFQCLLPSQAPGGCWPSQYPLAFSQQLAVNEIWRRHSDCSGIFAVNGPPGTGKTTLLRDVAAAVVTKRAQALVLVDRAALAAKTSFRLGDKRIPYHPLHQSMLGFSIVIASANNGAVENVSLELPEAKAVPESVLRESDYFSGLATELLGKPAWGLLAARLGNKANRDEFLNTFWWSKPKETQGEGPPPPELFTPKRGEGLAYHLNLIKSGKRVPTLLWDDAVRRFTAAQQEEVSIRAELIQASKLSGQIENYRGKIGEVGAARNAIAEQLNQAREEYAKQVDEVSESEEACSQLRQYVNDAEQRLTRHESNKPGLWDWIATFGRSHRQWWDRHHMLTQELDAARNDISRPLLNLQQAKAKLADQKRRVTELDRSSSQIDGDLEKLKKELRASSSLLGQAREGLGDFWPDPTASDDKREKSAPWAREDWRRAREAVFLAALDVHRAFIESHSSEILANINLASDWLQGKKLPKDAASAAMESLCLIVPVISTTFASIPRMFSRIGRETIGWLLIDEAGQALPQQAVGAIWRAARTVVVGDPKQLEPVSGIPPTVEGALARRYGVAPLWWPSEASTQILADQTMNLGTYLPDVDKGKVWVGCPLRVHRRCDDPMFTVSNKIAYDGLMVLGKTISSTPLPKSCWIDVVGKTSEGNWIPEEGDAVRAVLTDLRQRYGVQPADIFMISPFRDCANRLERLAKQLGFDTKKTGTVHTTQGKEAEVVVLVLGGNHQKPGAKGWAASRPNLLNVAVSRAKKNLYVIGDRATWEKQQYFVTLSQHLPGSDVAWPDLEL
ncbi:MAG: AAA domain-containing protein [Betaproteobacteria bacterium]|nr:AAA domain-containing protein [Betaproteobacteria bacterium]